jgi:adenylate kinase
MHVVLLGPPGAGKGTQAKLLSEQFDLCQISLGDILRKAMQDDTPVGREAADYMKRGELVPDNMTVKIIAERLKDPECRKGFILDGFPRTIAQAESLETILQSMGLSLDAVLFLKVPREVILQRIAGRRECSNGGTRSQPVSQSRTETESRDQCGTELQREDDCEETLATRLRVYEAQTAPLVNYYRERGKLREIDGDGSVEETHQRILDTLSGRR